MHTHSCGDMTCEYPSRMDEVRVICKEAVEGSQDIILLQSATTYMNHEVKHTILSNKTTNNKITSTVFAHVDRECVQS